MTASRTPAPSCGRDEEGECRRYLERRYVRLPRLPQDNYLYRYVGAKLGLYGNSKQDAIYFGFFVDANHQPLDASKSDYELHFAKGDLPPNKAFWSMTMYDGKTQLLVANPLKRYLLNSTTLESYKYGADGSLTLYASHDNPGPGK